MVMYLHIYGEMRAFLDAPFFSVTRNTLKRMYCFDFEKRGWPVQSTHNVLGVVCTLAQATLLPSADITPRKTWSLSWMLHGSNMLLTGSLCRCFFQP
jgi:hypothetical protein